jgi:adenylosuccinate synthase
MKRAIITVGLQFGDEAKGACVDSLCRRSPVDYVVRYSGGCQAGHNVQTAAGNRHCFSQFGSGTLAGVKTILGPQVVIDPFAINREQESLRRNHKIFNPWQYLQIADRCLVSTPYHQALNRFKERLRGRDRHGSCGMGLGETRSYWLEHGEDAIFAVDLFQRSILVSKLDLLRRRVIEQIHDHHIVGLLPSEDEVDIALRGIDILLEMAPATLARNLRSQIDALAITSLSEILGQLEASRTVVFEGAQGVLLDEYAGFHPHTTWSEVTDRLALDLIEGCGGSEEICTLGLIRAFTTRHGAGPLPTEDVDLTGRLIDVGNPTNPWQGRMRVGHLDLPLLHYAIQACQQIDGLAVSWLDAFDVGSLCVSYDDLPPQNSLQQQISGPPTPTRPDLYLQELRGRCLVDANPRYETVDREGLLNRLATIAPVVMKASGPTHSGRLWSDLHLGVRLTSLLAWVCILIWITLAMGETPGRSNLTPGWRVISRSERQDQGDWLIDYCLKNNRSIVHLLMPDQVFIKIDGWVSNSRVAVHANPRRSVILIEGMAGPMSTAEVIPSPDDSLRCRERAVVHLWDDTTKVTIPASRADPEPLSSIMIKDGTILHIRIRLEHQHCLYGDYDPLLGLRNLELRLGAETIREVLSLDHEQYFAQPEKTWFEPSEDRKDRRYFISAPDSLLLDAATSGEQYFRFPERKVRYSTRMRLRFYYRFATRTEGTVFARIAQYRETANSWRVLSKGGFEFKLAVRDRWTLVERVFTTQDEATALALDLRIANAEFGEVWFDDVTLEALDGGRPSHP